jgi:uncharacterized cupredoxin-like copper-binding protein
MKRATTLLLVVAIVAVVAVAGFLLTRPTARELTVGMSEFVFLLDGNPNPTIRLKAGVPVKLTVINRGGVTHELVIVEKEVLEKVLSLGAISEDKLKEALGGEPEAVFGVELEHVKPWESRTITFTPDKPGTYAIACFEDEPGEIIHAHRGMHTILIVEP